MLIMGKLKFILETMIFGTNQANLPKRWLKMKTRKKKKKSKTCKLSLHGLVQMRPSQDKPHQGKSYLTASPLTILSLLPENILILHLKLNVGLETTFSV